jgi:hypothetical protein
MEEFENFEDEQIEKFSGDTSTSVKKVERNIYTKVSRDLMIDDISNMILHCRKRADIVDRIVNYYGYASGKDIICEVNKLIAKQFSGDEIKIAARKVNHLYERTIEDEEMFIKWKLMAAEQLSKLMGHYKPEVQITNNTLNLNVEKKLEEYSIEELLKIKEIKEN